MVSKENVTRNELGIHICKCVGTGQELQNTLETINKSSFLSKASTGESGLRHWQIWRTNRAGFVTGQLLPVGCISFESLIQTSCIVYFLKLTFFRPKEKTAGRLPELIKTNKKLNDLKSVNCSADFGCFQFKNEQR